MKPFPWVPVLLAGGAGFLFGARSEECDPEQAAERDLWVERAREAAWRLEQETGDEYEWPDERLDDE